MMNHHSQNLFYRLQLTYGVLVRGLTRKRLEIHLEHKQPLFSKLLTRSFRQIFHLPGLANQITMQNVPFWVSKSEWNLFPLQVHCIYGYVKTRSKSRSLGLSEAQVIWNRGELWFWVISRTTGAHHQLVKKYFWCHWSPVHIFVLFIQGNKTEMRDAGYFNSILLREDVSNVEGTWLYQVTHEYTPVCPITVRLWVIERYSFEEPCNSISCKLWFRNPLIRQLFSSDTQYARSVWVSNSELAPVQSEIKHFYWEK